MEGPQMNSEDAKKNRGVTAGYIKGVRKFEGRDAAKEKLSIVKNTPEYGSAKSLHQEEAADKREDMAMSKAEGKISEGETEKAKVERRRFEREDAKELKLREEIARKGGYDFVGRFVDGVAVAKKEPSSFELIDVNGNKISERDFYYIGEFHDGRAVAVDGYQRDNVGGVLGYEIIDKKGKTIVGPQEGIKPIGNFSEGYLPAYKVEVDSKSHQMSNVYGYITEDGTETLFGRFKEVGSFVDGVARVVDQEGKVLFIDKAGNKISNKDFKDTRSFFEGVSPAKKEGVWLLVDKSGNPVNDKRFEDMGYFSEGLLAVKQGDVWGFIDSSGNMIIPPKFHLYDFQSPYIFKDGVVKVAEKNESVMKKNKEYYIDIKGNKVFTK